MHTFICKMKPYIQPFERKLALAELAAIAGSEPKPVRQKLTVQGAHQGYFLSDLWSLSASPTALAQTETPLPEVEALEFEVVSHTQIKTLINNLAYWESVSDEGKHLTNQVIREATINIARNDVELDLLPQLLPFGNTIPLPNRRCLRYGTHGIHEYRGKFFPQLVRSLLNIAKVPDHGVIADPTCGSGTTLVETVLSGYHGLGLDLNPLSVLMSQTKCALFSAVPADVMESYQGLRTDLLRASQTPDPTLPYFSQLSQKDQGYLREWFSERVLTELDVVSLYVHALPTGALRDFMRLSISNIMRRVSWQKEADLRVRKEVKDDTNIHPVLEFLTEVESALRTFLAFLYQNQGKPLGTCDIQEGTAVNITKFWKQWLGKVDVVITSPPYATALPYLDTDRLSLYYLGLLSRSGHRSRDLEMIGNREISDKRREQYWDLFQQRREDLPMSAVDLIERIYRLNAGTQAGFRRQNVPALLAKYFLDMHEVMDGIARLLKPGAHAYIVIGNNHTIAGGEKVEIETANILGEIATAVGLQQCEHIPMEMLVSREIFKNNAVASEVILSLRRPAQ